VKRLARTNAHQSRRPHLPGTAHKSAWHVAQARSIVLRAAAAAAAASLCACHSSVATSHPPVTSSPPIACGVASAPGCAGPATTAPTTPTTAPTIAPTESSSASDVTTATITDGDGLLFTVAVTAPTRTNSIVVGGLDKTTLAVPASFYYAHFVLTVTNQQTTAAPLDSLVAGGGSGSVTVGLPPSQLPAGFDCQNSENGYTAPNGLCQVTGAIFPGVSSVGVDLTLPDGYAVTAGTNPSADGEQPTIAASGTTVLNLYAGPFPTDYTPTGMRVLFGIGQGPQMIAAN
jgi:hypothetical protein